MSTRPSGRAWSPFPSTRRLRRSSGTCSLLRRVCRSVRWRPWQAPSRKAIEALVRISESAYVPDQWTEQPDAHYLLTNIVVMRRLAPDHTAQRDKGIKVPHPRGNTDGGRHFQSAWGTNKKEAEQKAALNALVELDVLERASVEDGY